MRGVARMIKLFYPAKSERWGHNDLEFENWWEYWKTIGYLSNPDVHRYNNCEGDIELVLERNTLSDSYTDTPRIYYYGNEYSFRREFPDLYSIHRGVSTGSAAKFRINRKEFGESLINDFGFIVRERVGKRDPVILPANEEYILNRVSSHRNFIRDAWDEGYNLGNLM